MASWEACDAYDRASEAIYQLWQEWQRRQRAGELSPEWLSFYTSERRRLQEIIEANKVEVRRAAYMPPYSPRENPLAMAWSHAVAFNAAALVLLMPGPCKASPAQNEEL